MQEYGHRMTQGIENMTKVTTTNISRTNQFLHILAEGKIGLERNRMEWKSGKTNLIRFSKTVTHWKQLIFFVRTSMVRIISDPRW